MAQDEKQQAQPEEPRTPKKDPGPVSGWAAADYLAQLGGLGLDSSLEQLFGLSPETWLRRVPGRETFAWPGQPGWIIKRTVGGESKDFWYERLRGQARSPARRELENLLALAAQGFPVPEGLAWYEDPEAAGHPRRRGRSALVMVCVQHRGSLRDGLKSATPLEKRDLMGQLTALVIRLHQAGWIHRDLYLQHFVCAAGGLVLLDVGRARQRSAPRERWFVKDLAALHFSAPPNLGRSERLRFLRAWLAARGEQGAPGRRLWVKRITRRAGKMASHRPKYLDAGDSVDAELFP